MEPVRIYTEKEKEVLIGRYGTKHLNVVVNCQKCGHEYVVQLYRLWHNALQLCRKCKISETKKNASPEQKQAIKEKMEKTCLKLYGVTNPTYLPDHNEKTKHTIQKEYGVNYAGVLANNPDYVPINIRKKNSCKKLETYEDSEERLDMLQNIPVTKWDTRTKEAVSKILIKRRQTNLEKYGPHRSTSCRYLYKNQLFDSSWELAVWIWAHDMGKQIIHDPPYIEYEFNGISHAYYPDFEIDGQLVEVKGDLFFKQDGTMQNPFNHTEDALFEAKHQCGLQNGVQFWTKKEMVPILQYITATYGSKYLNQFKKSK